MNGVRFHVGALLLTASISALGVVRWRTALPITSTRAPTIPSIVAAATDSLDLLLDEAEDLTITNDPFRLANAPATVRYDPSNENGAIGSSGGPPSRRPVMTLKAIVGGPPWQAVVDGIPGQPPGTVVRTGASFDKLRARVVTRDSVVIQGPDTTWVLSFRKHP